MLRATEEVNRKAVGKETIATLHQVLFDGWRSGAIVPDGDGTSVFNYLRSKLNMTQYCQSGVFAPAPCNHPDIRMYTSDRFVLPSGAVIGLNHLDPAFFGPNLIPSFWIDVNNIAGPNGTPDSLGGDAGSSDLTIVYFNIFSQPITNGAAFNGTLRPGEMRAGVSGSADLVYNLWMDARPEVTLPL